MLRILRRQGYAAAGWRQVVAESETPWGSQAHHFPGGKTQLATEALQHAAAFERLLRTALAPTPPRRRHRQTGPKAAASELAACG